MTDTTIMASFSNIIEGDVVEAARDTLIISVKNHSSRKFGAGEMDGPAQA